MNELTKQREQSQVRLTLPSREGRRPIGQQKDQKNKEIRDALFPDCPIRNILARVGDKCFAEVPPRVEYTLTPRAYSFLPLVENMIRWAKENMEEIIADRTRNA